MDLMLIVKIVAVIASLSGAIGYKYYFKAPNDNPIEQLAEEIIKQSSGVDIDLSPEDKNK